MVNDFLEISDEFYSTFLFKIIRKFQRKIPKISKKKSKFFGEKRRYHVHCVIIKTTRKFHQSNKIIFNSEQVDDDENESAMASANDQREEELQVFWSYIVGMLTNLNSLPLERIHQMLRLFASHGPNVEFSEEELKNFLQRKVREHALVFAAGVYQLPK